MEETDSPTSVLVPLDSSIISNSRNILQEALNERSLQLRFETPETAKDLKCICPPYVNNLEKLIFELFIEDQEESLRLLSLRDVNTKDTVGFIFWRNISEEEMKTWSKNIHTKNQKALPIQYHELASNLNNMKISHPPQHVLVRSNSAKSPEDDFDETNLTGWIKIELMCVRKDKTGMKLGSILLAAALAFAAIKEGKTHGVLQVAGGESNNSAYELYKKFHFEDGKEYFNNPNNNLMVLWNIRHALETLNWEGFLMKNFSNTKALKDKSSFDK